MVMMSSEFALVYITTSNADEAGRIGGQLVTERLAACVNIVPAVQSIYRWEGAITRSDEAVIIAKTLAAKILELNDRVRSLHSYQTPAIVAVPLLHVDADFARWIEGEVA
jgi:periplasmic divalent cation tolerance protein